MLTLPRWFCIGCQSEPDPNTVGPYPAEHPSGAMRGEHIINVGVQGQRCGVTFRLDAAQ